MGDIRQSPLWAKYLKELGWESHKFEKNFIYYKKLPFLGTVIKYQRPEGKINLKKLLAFAKEKKALILKVEPQKDSREFQKFGFHEDSFPLSPPKTILIDIAVDEKQLLSQMHPKTRYNIGLSQKKKIKIETSDDISLFCQFSPLPEKETKTFWKTFTPKNAFMLVALSDNKEPLAGVLIGLWQKRAHYMFAFSRDEGKKLFAPTILVWESFLKCKKMGLKIFDFDGIYDKRYHSATRAWRGFTRFKKGFGGKEIEYPPVYSKFFFPKFW